MRHWKVINHANGVFRLCIHLKTITVFISGITFSLAGYSTAPTCMCKHLHHSCMPACVAQYVLNNALCNPRHIHKQNTHLCTPLMCTGNRGVSECYTSATRAYRLDCLFQCRGTARRTSSAVITGTVSALGGSATATTTAATTRTSSAVSITVFKARSHCDGNCKFFSNISIYRCRHNANTPIGHHDTHFCRWHFHHEWVLNPFMMAMATTPE